MKTLSSIIVAGVSAVALLAAAPVSAQDNAPVAGEKRMLPNNPMNTEPLNPPGPAGSRNGQADGSDAAPVAGEKRMAPENVMNTEPLNPPGPAGNPNAPAAGGEAVGAIGSDWVPNTNPVAADDLIGADVVSYHNWTIGEVEGTTVVDGKTVYLVAVDQQLGMGSRLISIHEDHTSVFRNRENLSEFRIAVNATQDQIRQQPEYMRDGSSEDNRNNPRQTR
ncbi:MAG: hypothetical protein WD767_03145 [Alphaproteobacteria bacterium]